MKLLGKLKSARNSASKAAGDATKAIDELRALRTRLLDERDDIAGRPRPQAEAEDAVAQSVLASAERAVAGINLASLMRPGRGGPTLNLSDQEIAALALAANVESVVATIRARLAQKYEGGPQPLTADDQRAELERIDAELLACELSEEGIVRELEGAGFEVQRRVDADARALLAADAELK